jgi:hypothetical protein
VYEHTVASTAAEQKQFLSYFIEIVFLLLIPKQILKLNRKGSERNNNRNGSSSSSSKRRREK